MAYNLGSAYINVVPSMRGFGKSLGAQMTTGAVAAQASSAGTSIGSKLAAGITGTLKTGLKVGGIITGAVGAVTLKGGLDRALGIEDAQAKMKGLGYDTKATTKIMDNALASVEGTSFGLDEAATTAAGAVAAGIKPGKELEGVLTTVANTSAGAGTTMEEMGSIFNTVAANGKAYTGDIKMVADRGIPIWQSLGKNLGKTTAEVQKMASEGKISFKDFEAAAADASGNVALAMGDTTRGSLKNMYAAVKKLGAMFVVGLLPMAKTTFQGIQGLLNAVKAKLEPFVTEFFDKFGGKANKGIKDFFDGLIGRVESFDPTPVVDFFSNIGTWVQGIDFSSVGGMFSSIADGLKGITGGSGSSAGSAFAGIGEGLKSIVDAAPGVLALGLQVLGQALQFISDNADTIVTFLPLIVAGLVAWKVHTTATTDALIAQRMATASMTPFMIVNNGLILLNNLLEGKNARAKVLSTAATEGQTAATKASTLATRLWGVAMKVALGPIGWIIAGVTLLATGLYLFFTKTEVGKKIWSRVWGAIKATAAAVWEWIKGTLWPGLVAAWDAIAAGAIWLYRNAILPAWNGIKTAISVVASWVTGTLVPALAAAWDGIAKAAKWLYHNVIQPIWTGIKIAIAVVVTAVIVYVKMWVAIFKTVVAPVFKWLYDKVIKPVWGKIKAAIGAVVSWFRDTAWPAIKKVIANVKAGFNLMRDKVAAAWRFVKTKAIDPIIKWFRDVAWPLVKKVIDKEIRGFKVMRDKIKAAWDFVKSKAIDPIIRWFRDVAWPAIGKVLGKIKSGFKVMRDKIKSAWDFVKHKAILPVANWFRDTIQGRIENVTKRIKSAFDTMSKGVKKAWGAIKSAAKKPVRFVVQDVYNDTIKATFDKVAKKFGLKGLPAAKLGFASGGVLPGYTPGRDVHDFYSPSLGRLSLSGGEAIMRPEWTRAVGGPSAVAAMNARARKGMAFKSGGVFGKLKNIGGDALDWLAKKTDAVAKVLKNPLGALKTLASKALSIVPGKGFMKDSSVAAMKYYAGKAGEWLKNGLSSANAGSGVRGGVPAATGTGGSLAWASRVARQFGLTMTSGYRPGARTSSGSLSMHGLNRARDFSNGVNTPQEMAFFNYILKNSKPTELLFTPAGSRNVHRGGRQYANSGTLARIHWNHVHVAYKNGGVLGAPFLHDNGGWHNPDQLSVNMTRKPEAVLTDSQWRTMYALAERDLNAGSQGGLVIHGDVSTGNVEELFRKLRSEQRKERALRPRI